MIYKVRYGQMAVLVDTINEDMAVEYAHDMISLYQDACPGKVMTIRRATDEDIAYHKWGLGLGVISYYTH